MLAAGRTGGEVKVHSRIERPQQLAEDEARSLWAEAGF